MEKGQLRLDLQKRLLAISQKQKIEKSKNICKNLISTLEFQKASVIMMYLSLSTEADTSDAILASWQLGKTVVVPKVSWEQRHMIPVVINSLEMGFSTEVGGIRNPQTGAPMPFEEIDLVVTPGLGFDKNGNRIGRGGGYFDRFFANKELRATKCGFAFDEQRVDSVPVTASDQKIDILVTDKDIIYFNKDKEL